VNIQFDDVIHYLKALPGSCFPGIILCKTDLVKIESEEF
jgi:hypothetical protein